MPQIFRVYQNNLAEIQDLINKEGWDCHIKAVVHIQASIYDKAELAVQHFDECYKPVCEIVADDLTHVFEVGNMGPEDRITRLDRMHSVSVGDIIEDESGERWMVAGMGFKYLTPAFREAA